jgi:mannose-1-phosphate guanylyltransferase
MHEELERVRAAWGSPEAPAVLADAFERMTPISIDYGILELEKGMRVIPADFGWADVGHWRAVHDVLAANPKSNVSRTPHVNVDSRGNLLYSYSGKLIATAGVENMIIVETEDVILACPKDRAQDVRKLVSELEKKNMEKYL